jgi:hypothetical protein
MFRNIDAIHKVHDNCILEFRLFQMLNGHFFTVQYDHLNNNALYLEN